jgi:hypothetical protein
MRDTPAPYFAEPASAVPSKPLAERDARAAHRARISWVASALDAHQLRPAAPGESAREPRRQPPSKSTSASRYALARAPGDRDPIAREDCLMGGRRRHSPPEPTSQVARALASALLLRRRAADVRHSRYAMAEQHCDRRDTSLPWTFRSSSPAARSGRATTARTARPRAPASIASESLRPVR